MQSWDDCIRYIDDKIRKREPLNVEELAKQVEHLGCPRDIREPLKAYLRQLCKERAAVIGLDAFFDGRKNIVIAESREHYMRLLRRTESRLRHEGKRLAILSLKLSKRENKSPTNQLLFNYDSNTIENPDITSEIRQRVDSGASNVVPLRPPSDEDLWSTMTAAFTAVGDESVPPFSRVMVELTRRQLGANVPEEIWREDIFPMAKLRDIYEQLVAIVTDLANENRKKDRDSGAGTGEGQGLG